MRRIAATIALTLIPLAAVTPGRAVGQGCFNIGVGNVDVMLLLDDTGSFAGNAPVMQTVFANVVSKAQEALPSASFAFGMSRLEEFAGSTFPNGGEYVTGRPFILNQPITTDIPLLTSRIDDTTPGYGGDGPETTIEALHQLATGAGFDGNADGDTTDSGPAAEPGYGSAGSGYFTPGTSGDVPAYTAGGGGAGWRPGARHLILLATDINTVAPFTAGPIPPTITGVDGSSVSSSAFSSGSRFGNVGDIYVAPAGAATVQETINELNSIDAHVVGVVPSGVPIENPTGPTYSPAVLTSALGILTGAVDEEGLPLVFNLGYGGSALEDALTAAIVAGANIPIQASEANAESSLASGTAVTPAADITIDKLGQTIYPAGGSSSIAEHSESLPGDFTLSFSAGSSSSSGTPGEEYSQAAGTTSLDDVELLAPGGMPLVRVRKVRGEARAAGDGGPVSVSSDGTSLVGLTIAGQAIDPAVAPNTEIPVPGGRIVLREETLSTGTGYATLKVTPIHVQLAQEGVSLDLEIGSAYAAAGCGSTIPGDPPVPRAGDPIRITPHIEQAPGGSH